MKRRSTVPTASQRYLPLVSTDVMNRRESCVIGILPGEGSGPEIVAAAQTVLDAVAERSRVAFELRVGGPIGLEAERRFGASLTPEVSAFCAGVFADGGAILAGPGGGRFVYDLRRHFNLYCKLIPVVPAAELRGIGNLTPESVAGVDLLIVREASGGEYYGDWSESANGSSNKRVEHRYAYEGSEVRRLVDAAARIAAVRAGRLAVAVKRGGLPPMAKLWISCTERAAAEADVECTILDFDHAAYHMIDAAPELDVIVASNLFADVLTDLSALFLGSRGLSFGACFSRDGAAVYQTNHGAAFNLAGRDRANPCAQILSLAMLLRESFGLEAEAMLIEEALREAWAAGHRTDDILGPSCSGIGTREMGKRVAESVLALELRVA